MILFSAASVEKEIQAQYDRWSKAYMAHESETLVGILSPDYTLTNALKETLGYGVYTAKLRLLKDAPKETIKYSTTIKKLIQRGDEADVIAVETMESAVKAGRSLHRHQYLDTWIRYDAGWRLRKTVTQKEWTDVVKSSKS